MTIALGVLLAVNLVANMVCLLNNHSEVLQEERICYSPINIVCCIPVNFILSSNVELATHVIPAMHTCMQTQFGDLFCCHIRPHKCSIWTHHYRHIYGLGLQLIHVRLISWLYNNYSRLFHMIAEQLSSSNHFLYPLSFMHLLQHRSQILITGICILNERLILIKITPK